MNEAAPEPPLKRIVHVGQQVHQNRVVFQGLSFVEFGIYAYGVLFMLFAYMHGDLTVRNAAIVMAGTSLLGVIAQHGMFYTANIARGWHITLAWIHKVGFFGNIVLGLLIVLRVLGLI